MLSSPMRKSLGFTLLEVIVTLLILGIVSTVVITRHLSANVDARDAAFMGRIKSHLRYARNASMNSDATWWIDFNSGSYILNKRDADGTNTTAVFPGEGTPAVTFPSGFSGPDTDVYFNDWGQPANSAGAPIGTVVTLSFSGQTVTIEPTGYIP